MNLNSNQKVMIQGITGKEANFWLKKMLEIGTNIVAGTSPGKGGEVIYNVPVYNTVLKAKENHEIDTSILFVPPKLCKVAAYEAIEAEIKQIIILGDGVPVHDTMSIIALAKSNNLTILGPNTPGIVFPGKSSLGIMPCWLNDVFKPGSIAVLSRSGSLGNEICYQISKSGFGISKFIGIGGDALVGTTFSDLLFELDKDDSVKGITIVGELGGNMEENAAKYISELNKPTFAFIAGKSSPVGVPMGHAGALVEGSTGSTKSKINILRENGAYVANTPGELSELIEKFLR